ncbi:tRNA (adenine(58)-N(1))-methyltransferase non-catalytic subunit trm6 [Myotisia sp. PD_48]|nr:tRNA (adenine(58)-N(1))-methyltransferase non-catalytic subunit trm6 [Myotisia sp. PD_48]
MHSTVSPHSHVVVKLPSDSTKILQIIPNTNIALGKYGSFPANQIIGRPYFLTYEITDSPDENGHVLRIVPAAELHTEALISEEPTPVETEEGEGLDNNDEVIPRTNRHIVDEPSTQQLTAAEIENLKQTGAGKEIIAKLLESHSALDQKTEFSRAKYMLRKRKKYLQRFTIIPLDVASLTQWILEQKDASRIMELREEMLGLIGCWGNVHHAGHSDYNSLPAPSDHNPQSKLTGRWLIVDDTAGLVTAAMAERAGILYPPESTLSPTVEDGTEQEQPQEQIADQLQPSEQEIQAKPPPDSDRDRDVMAAQTTTLTVIHSNSQPNLSLLKYFSFEANDSPQNHPLSSHLKTLSWLQLVDPLSDPLYSEPSAARASEEEIASWRPSKRGIHFKKIKRWERVRRVVDETRAGGFDGLIVASLLDPATILKHTVPLLAGSAPIVVYSPYIEPLVKLTDLYSKFRRTAYITLKREEAAHAVARAEKGAVGENDVVAGGDYVRDSNGLATENNEEEFPVDPTLVLAATVQTARVRPWQVLPGRTHPLMTGRGGAEGYIFHAIRALPAEGRVEARGLTGRKKRKLNAETPQNLE